MGYNAYGPIEDIAEKVRAGVRLTREDGVKLFRCTDLLAVGALAHTVKTARHQQAVYYVLNRHLNYSNICLNGCAFCAFGKPPHHPQAFELTVEEVLEKLSRETLPSTREIHIVGGCHPSLRLDYYERLLRTVRNAHPHCVIKAFTAVEIDNMAHVEGITAGEVLERLHAAGLEMLPGGGAEIFAERVRQQICPKKSSATRWLEIHRLAHRLGIPTNATMLFGHVETIEDRVDHLVALRELQDETRGFVCFIPLPFQAKRSPLQAGPGPTGVDILKTIAVSRLLLDNIPHIKAYWIMLTLKLAQLALSFGADDLDGTVIEEKIGHMAGADSEESLTREELCWIIESAGWKPVERDGLFRPLEAPPSDYTNGAR